MVVDKTIFLVGMMGSGKSTVGAELAAHLNLPFIDTDQVIENKEGRSIFEIFEQEGEPYFREAEKHLLHTLTDEVKVVACGGGLPCFFNNMEALKEKGVVIYLDAKPARLYQRIKGDGLRPKLQDVEAFALLFAQREATYKKAHFTIDAHQGLEQILAEVLSLLTATTNQ